jgi:PadR family transcriptional regulator PadR
MGKRPPTTAFPRILKWATANFRQTRRPQAWRNGDVDAKAWVCFYRDLQATGVQHVSYYDILNHTSFGTVRYGSPASGHHARRRKTTILTGQPSVPIAIYRNAVLKPKNDLLQGTLALLVLKTLARGTMHGYGMTLHIQLISKDILRVEEGSLYPALHRMEQDGWVSAEWGISENNRRARYYRLTAKGRKQLAEEEKNWERFTQAVAHVLQFA